MSGNKMTDAKLVEDLNIDSGFQSGAMLFDEDSSGELRPESEEEIRGESDDKNVLVVVERASDAKEVLVGSADPCELSKDLADVKLDAGSTEFSASSGQVHTMHLPLKILYEQDDDGDTQLHIAAAHELEKPMSILIRLCPSKELLNLTNDFGQTALHLAVMSNNAVITRMLVLAGAEIGIRDRWGETPLHKATAASNVKCMQALLMPVAQNLQRKMLDVLDQKNYNGQACVHVAARLGHIESLQALLFYGADINSRETLAGWTALHIAAARGNVRLVEFLQRCGGIKPRTCDFHGHTPRRFASHTRAATLFDRHDDSETDSDSEDDMFEDETDSLYEKYSNQSQTVVA